MIEPKYFFELLKNKRVSFYTGVPDSALKSFCAYVQDFIPQRNHIIAANEGNAVGLAAGHHLATGEIPLVYMQNSGQGNAINPITSLIDSEVYNIPVLFLIGWRGKPGEKDEPQHKKQGRITLDLLNTLEIENEILSENQEALEGSVSKAFSWMEKTGKPYAFVAQKGIFSSYKLSSGDSIYEMSREEAIILVSQMMSRDSIVVSTTGKTSRELFEWREECGGTHERDFLTVGSMGHTSQIALGIALAKENKKVYCFDGDGSVIMHLGGLTTIGQQKPENFYHIVFNNGTHDSVGGQPTAGYNANLSEIAKYAGYNYVASVSNKVQLHKEMTDMETRKGPVFLEVRVQKGARSNLGRPTSTPIENKENFMRFLRDENNK